MKKPYIILLAGILLLGLTGGLYRVYRYQRAVEESVVADRKEVVKPTPTPAPPAVVVKAVILSTKKQPSQIELVIAPKVMPPGEEGVSLSAISFKAELSIDLASGVKAAETKLTMDSSFKAAGWQLIHNKVTSNKGKITVEIAGVLVGKKFGLDGDQAIGTIKIEPVLSSAKLILRLDPEATRFLAGDAVTALPVVSGN